MLQAALAALAPLGDTGSLDGKCWAIIVAMGGAIAAMGLFVRILYSNYHACQEARAKFSEEQLNLLKTLRREFEKKE